MDRLDKIKLLKTAQSKRLPTVPNKLDIMVETNLNGKRMLQDSQGKLYEPEHHFERPVLKITIVE
jgi:hypothetical protein